MLSKLCNYHHFWWGDYRKTYSGKLKIWILVNFFFFPAVYDLFCLVFVSESIELNIFNTSSSKTLFCYKQILRLIFKISFNNYFQRALKFPATFYFISLFLVFLLIKNGLWPSDLVDTLFNKIFFFRSVNLFTCDRESVPIVGICVEDTLRR